MDTLDTKLNSKIFPSEKNAGACFLWKTYCRIIYAKVFIFFIFEDHGRSKKDKEKNLGTLWPLCWSRLPHTAQWTQLTRFRIIRKVPWVLKGARRTELLLFSSYSSCELNSLQYILILFRQWRLGTSVSYAVKLWRVDGHLLSTWEHTLVKIKFLNIFNHFLSKYFS